MPPPKQKQREPKPVIKLAPPFTNPLWPEVGSEEHETILSMLYSLLEPVGRHRQASEPSLKRKRTITGNEKSTGASEQTMQKDGSHVLAPQMLAGVLVGLNSVTRHLESLARISNPRNFIGQSGKVPKIDSDSTVDGATDEKRNPTHVSVLFVPIPKNHIIHEHLPLLAQTASLAFEKLPATRIVRLRGQAEDRLAAALRLPRVGVIGLLESAVETDPQARALVQFVRELVEPVKVPWLEESCKWMGVKVVTDAEDKKH